LLDSSVKLLSSLSVLYTEQLNCHRTDLIVKCFFCKILRLLWLGSRCFLPLSLTSSVNIGSMKKKRSRSECERSILTYCIKPVKVSISCRHNRFTLHSQIAAPHKTTDSHVTVQHCQRVLRFLLKSQNVLTQNQISSYASVTNTVLGVQ